MKIETVSVESNLINCGYNILYHLDLPTSSSVSEDVQPFIRRPYKDEGLSTELYLHTNQLKTFL